MISDLTVTEKKQVPAQAGAKSPEGAATLAATLRLFGVATGTPYGLLLRDGRVLCALPASRAEALMLLSLYQPQRPRAKLLAMAFRACAAIGLHPLVLRRWRLPGEGDAAGGAGQAPPGVLVGSGGHLCERAVVCLHEGDSWTVCKVAFGPEGHVILSHEAAMLRLLFKEFPEIPKVTDFSRKGDASLLRMSHQAGCSWRSGDLTPLRGLLGSWADRDAPRRLAGFGEWARIESVLRRFPRWEARLADLSAMELRPSIRHGDLTRPNLRLGASGRLLVHDWERGAPDGIPGLDLAHFLVQDRLFRKRMAPGAVVAGTLAELRGPESADLIRRLGWAGREGELMALSFAFNTGAGYMDQSPMIACLP
jgi:hypothetical protein